MLQAVVIAFQRVLCRVEHAERYLVRRARVCLLICAARVILSSLLPIRTSRIALRYPLLERSRSATISAAVITLMVLLGRELRNALP